MCGARDTAVNDAPSPSRFAGSGVDFKGKLIGVEDVVEARGDKMCQIAMAKMKAGVKASGEHKLRIAVNVSLDGIKIIDDKSSVSIVYIIHAVKINNNSGRQSDFTACRIVRKRCVCYSDSVCLTAILLDCVEKMNGSSWVFFFWQEVLGHCYIAF